LGIEEKPVLRRLQGIQIRLDDGNVVQQSRLQEERLVTARLGVGERLQPGKTGARGGDLGDPQALQGQKVLGDAPALALGADQVLGRHLDVLERALGHPLHAVEQNDRP
jgi:hypothetical protein